jgi:hypothetical protein
MAWHNEVRHTPWHIDGEMLRDDNGDEVAVFAGDTNKVERALLAAAPKLLAAARMAVAALDASEDIDWPEEQALAALVAAISKAEGR